MNEKEEKSLSKYVSLILRHQPDLIRIIPDTQGWVLVDELITKSKESGSKVFDRAQLEQVVHNNSKQRFEFDEQGKRIRARQGHSITVDLGYSPSEPPQYLYHGTVEKVLTSIMQEGLQKQQRHHVHLSPDTETATMVGNRRGKALILRIDAAAMQQDGHTFYVTENKVWLCEAVPPQYIKLLDA